MPLRSTSRWLEPVSMRAMIVSFTLLLLLSFLTANIITPSLWRPYTGLMHSIAELVCVFFALALVSVIFCSYKMANLPARILAFGYFSVALFDIVHTITFPPLNYYPSGYFDLGARYWVLGRLAEGLTLALVAFLAKHPTWGGRERIRRLLENRDTAVLATLTGAGLVIGIIWFFPSVMPILLTPSGVTPAKMLLEGLVLCLLIAALLLMRTKVDAQGWLSNYPMFMSILISIPCSLCFVFFSEVDGFLSAFGHILKFLSYFYLFRGSFVSTVTYPYKKLAEANEQMSSILDTLPAGVAMHDAHGKVSYINRIGCELLDCEPTDVLGLQDTDALRLFSLSQELATRNVSSEPVKEWLTEVVTLKKQRRKVSLNTITTTSGNVLYVLADAEAEQEIELLKLQTQTIFNSLDKAALILDTRQRVLNCNSAFVDITGMPARTVIGASLDRVAKLLNLDHVRPTLVKEQVEIEIKETGRSFLVSMTPIRNLNGVTIGSLILASEVTKLKQDQLRLIQQEKLSVVGQMAAGLVHEIKNPLTAIKGFNQMIMYRLEDEKLKQYTSLVDQEVDALSNIISDFLSFSRPREPAFTEVSLNSLLESMQLMLESQAFVKGVAIQFVFTEHDLPVYADEGQIKQVVLNLVKNAFEATSGSSSPRVVISTTYNNGEMQLSIADNGRGMTREEQSKLGDPFYTTKEMGTGLGLSICREIIVEHKGELECRSTLGKGTTFSIFLPCLVNEHKQAD